MKQRNPPGLIARAKAAGIPAKIWKEYSGWHVALVTSEHRFGATVFTTKRDAIDALERAIMRYQMGLNPWEGE